MVLVKRVGRALTLGTLLPVAGCTLGTETGNPSANPEPGNPVESSPPAELPTASLLRHVSVVVRLDSVEVEAEDEIEDEVEEAAEVEGSPVDLDWVEVKAAWLATESMTFRACAGSDFAALEPHTWELVGTTGHGFDTALASFCGVNLRASVAASGTGVTPPGLEGASLWLQGTRADGVPFEVRSVAPLEVNIATSAAPLAGSELVVRLDLSAGLPVLAINRLSPDSDGVVRVSPLSNPTLLGTLEARFGQGATVAEAEDDEEIDDDDALEPDD
jgi:hypothetical protein